MTIRNLAAQPSTPSLIEAIRARVEPLGGVELEIPARESNSLHTPLAQARGLGKG